jgi:hypothetical protein
VSVYVGPSQYPYGRMIMCHMVADTLGELHEMADRIGVQRRWFQDTRHPHYDVSKSKRELAVMLGAYETTDVGCVVVALSCRGRDIAERMASLMEATPLDDDRLREDGA